MSLLDLLRWPSRWRLRFSTWWIGPWGNVCVWVAFDHRRLPLHPSGRVAFGPLCSLHWPLLAVASHCSRLSIWCPSPSSPVAIASWTFAYHIGLGSTRPLRFIERLQWSWVTVAVRQNASEWSTFGWSPINDRSYSLLCLNFTGNQVLLASTRSHSSTAARIGLCNVGF